MNHAEQIQAFADEVTALVERYRQEFDLPVAAAVGVLELVKLDIYSTERDNLNDSE